MRLYQLLAIAICTSLLVHDARAQDVLTIGSGSAASGGNAQIPLYLRDAGGTPLGSDAGTGNRIQGIALKVSFSPASAVVSATFARAGVLQPLTPLYESLLTPPGAVSYAGLFAETSNPIPLTLNAAAPGDRIGTIVVTFSNTAIAGTAVTLSIDSATATLSNQAGLVGETVANAKLALVNGTATVDGATTTTILSSSSNPSTFGQSVSLTATVTSPAAGIISGTVTFQDGTTALGSPPLSSGQATLSTSALAAGTHSISATYNGDPTFLPSTSAPLSQVVNPATFAAPTGLAATAASASQVNLSWFAVTGADHYEVFRSANNAAFAQIASPAAAAFIDTNVTAGVTYLYEVRAVNASATPSAFSAIDPATTIVFTDDPLAVQTTVIRTVHLMELRSAVNAFRAAAGLPPFAFTDPSPAGVPIRATHVNELRSALGAARTALSLPPISFADATLTPNSMVAKAIHFQQIREAVK